MDVDSGSRQTSTSNSSTRQASHGNRRGASSSARGRPKSGGQKGPVRGTKKDGGLQQKKADLNATMLDNELESYMLGDARAGRNLLDTDLDEYMQSAPNPPAL